MARCTSGRWPLATTVFLLFAAPAAFATGGVWVPQGPAPLTAGQVTGITDGEVSGAIHTVVAHPTNANILWIGAVNGGIWRTDNANAASPSWVQQTDDQASLSIGAMELDPTDLANQTLVAGIGRYSSYGRRGGARTGLLRTTDGGTTWTPIDGGGDVVGLNVSGVAPRGMTIVISANAADTTADRGVHRSTDGGATWTQISDGTGATTGLPAGIAFDLVGDPGNQSRLFTVVTFADSAGGQNGVYRSTDTGATWTKVSDAAVDALLLSGPTSNAELAIGANDTVWLGIANSGRMAGFFRSPDGGDTWNAMDLPGTTTNGVHPGGQASIHMSIVADPQFSNLIYVGGDRQDFPNIIGASNFTGRLFRGDASQPTGSQWVHMTNSNALGPAGGGTASNSGPHADSREMVFDANGNIIETDDGGVYRRTSPRDNTGDWITINGDLQVNEMHDAAWDPVAQVGIGGSQDTGTPNQSATGNLSWFSVNTADGGDVAVDALIGGSMSARYSSVQGLQAFRREVYDAANTRLSVTFPARTVIGGGAPLVTQFVTPVVVNAAVPNRLIIGGSNSTYESLDDGTTITEVGPGIPVAGAGRSAVAYGSASNNDILYVGSGAGVFIRTGPHPAALTASATYPGGTVDSIVIDPDAPQVAFVTDSDQVFQTTDTGGSWGDATGDLQTLDPGTFRSLFYLPDSGGDDLLLVGSERGVFAARESSGFLVWSALGKGLPTVAIYDFDYDPTQDTLFAGTLGRGAWTLVNPLADGIFADGFDSGDTSAWTLTVP